MGVYAREQDYHAKEQARLESRAKEIINNLAVDFAPSVNSYVSSYVRDSLFAETKADALKERDALKKRFDKEKHFLTSMGGEWRDHYDNELKKQLLDTIQSRDKYSALLESAERAYFASPGSARSARVRASVIARLKELAAACSLSDDKEIALAIKIRETE